MAEPMNRSKTNQSGGPIYVYIWFDIEDYVTEEADDLPLIALKILEKHDARATCKMVAEKVRTLLEHERTDVISAIAAHDVGYHLDKHSRHPTVYEYLAGLEFLDGAREFMGREREGLELVEKVFERKMSCFRHPGPAWSSHFYPAVPRMGIPVYLDETAILNLDNGPYWYCGILNLNGANRNFVKFDYTFEDPSGIVRLKKQFKEIHDRLHGNGGGAVSFLFHLHTVINKEFWDAVNFARGENRSRKEYVRPTPQPTEVTERAWKDFEEIVAYMASFGDVKFITASDAARIYRRKEISYDPERIGSVLKKLENKVRYVKVGDDFASPSELFYLMTKCLVEYSRSGKVPSMVRTKEPFGPESIMASRGSGKVKTQDLLDASGRVLEYMDSTRRLPQSIKLDHGEQLSPADFMATGNKLLGRILRGTAPIPIEIEVARGRFLQSRFVHPKAFQEACGWIVLPKGFSAPKILEQTILQTWTLRPAVPRMVPHN